MPGESAFAVDGIEPARLSFLNWSNMSKSGYRKSHIPPANSMERGYLIDASKLKPCHGPKLQSPSHPAPLPPIIGELVIPEWTTVSALARLLGQKPFQIIADLIQLKIMATVNNKIEFEVSSKVARKYGFIAKRAA
jgi:hypothetical protein